MYRLRTLIRGAGVVVSVLALMAWPATADAATGPDAAGTTGAACRMRVLPAPNGAWGTRVTGGDHSGRHLVGEATLDETAFTRFGVHWVDGHVRVVDTGALQPYVQVWFADVSSHGVIVGTRLNDTGAFHTDAWVYRDGVARVLPALTPGDDTEAVAVNSRGDVVGTSRGTTSRVVLWPADRPGTVRELTTTDQSTYGWGVDIDDDGTVLGFMNGRPNPAQHPYVWRPDGTGFPLAAPAGTGYPEAMAIHHGWVAGTAWVPTGDGMMTSALARWNLRTGASVSMPDLLYFGPISVNKQGTIGAGTKLIYRNGHVRELGANVRVVSDRGTAAGTVGPVDGFGEAVLWTGC